MSKTAPTKERILFVLSLRLGSPKDRMLFVSQVPVRGENWCGKRGNVKRGENFGEVSPDILVITISLFSPPKGMDSIAEKIRFAEVVA